MCGILIALVVAAAIVGAVLHISAGWALIVVIAAAVVLAVAKARNPNAAVRTGKTGLLFTNVCPACKKHNKTGASRCAHCGTALVVAASEATKTCPDCAETVLAKARKCRYCGHEFSPAAAPST